MSSKYQKYIDEMLDVAVKFGADLGQLMDFSDLSIIRVEKILDYYCKDLYCAKWKQLARRLARKEVTQDKLIRMAAIWGIYLGEVMRRNHLPQYRWVYEWDQGTKRYHMRADQDRLDPVARCLKRLTGGKADDVVVYFDQCCHTDVYGLLRKE